MNWYEKLSKYFPIEEMKSKEHMDALLRERGDLYHKEEGPNYVLMYAETDDFIFIDYLYVAKDARGMGLGSKLIEKLKKKQKPIILEVEPLDYDDSDTEKRLLFYKRLGFKHAQSIGYRRQSLAINKMTHLEILYWSPTEESEEKILERMKKTYEMIHTYKDKKLYGESYLPADEALKIERDRNKGDILADL